jgi:phosphoheptose isomerase
MFWNRRARRTYAGYCCGSIKTDSIGTDERREGSRIAFNSGGAAQETAKSLKARYKLMVAGNSGSAAEAQHLVAEFVSRLIKDRPALRAIALTTGSSILTAVGNDYGSRAN